MATDQGAGSGEAFALEAEGAEVQEQPRRATARPEVVDDLGFLAPLKARRAFISTIT
jgi:hypothetical protein